MKLLVSLYKEYAGSPKTSSRRAMIGQVFLKNTCDIYIVHVGS